MILIPIRTEMVARRTPTANYAILTANILAYLLFNVVRVDALREFCSQHLVLNSGWPAVHQFFTYQFLHADIWHLGGNMLFLWVFGNSVNAKLGSPAYLMFYLSAGVFAALTFTVGSQDSLLGASGAIAGITTAYLVLFPRSKVTVLFIFFFITFFEVPAMLLIGVKIIIWDNIVTPNIVGAGNVATSAHLGGYAFGLMGAAFMLAVRAIPRDHFDMLGLIDRWNRRRQFQTAMADPNAQRQAVFGTVARPVARTPQAQRIEDQRLDKITDLRNRIAEHLERGELTAAGALYQELIAGDPNQCLPPKQQIEVARHFYSTGRPPQAASAFERYLSSYRDGHEANEIRLLVGIIYARDLKQYETAQERLQEASDRLSDESRKAQCREWIEFAKREMGGA